ncbi:hypothetical protein OHB33_00715 [Streptomyces sp. NBC_01558]|uniref:hypothetical protein n=1 Tax=Streptomyces sp. NBC_01558 TaxID=2975878 RepID=UPI002DD941B0|nr:hypothetical protein [Streptomyces sp. NBC_01558]WSD74951.1 hypothetical protein OHB33_00715 [Streptomyces sp. NBC_01558]
MLNPIDTDAVIRNGGAVGRYPDQIHGAVGWWMGSCLVVTAKASRLAVAHDGHPVSIEFADRLCQGATHAQHYACTVRYLRQRPAEELLAEAKAYEAPAAWVSTQPAAPGDTVHIRLYTTHGILLDETNGLADIRDLINQDRVPIPVNTQAQGKIVPWPPASPEGSCP